MKNDNIKLCKGDFVLVFGCPCPGISFIVHSVLGQLVFMGTVPEAFKFFGVSGLREITRLIDLRSENGEGRADEFIEKFKRMDI